MTTPLTKPDAHDAVRREERLERLPAVYKTHHERLACELALGQEDPLTIFARYGHNKDAALATLQSPAFAVILDRISREVKESGLSFRMKARAMAEDLLPEAYDLAKDDQVGVGIRVDLIQWITRMGDLEPVKAKDDGKAGGGGLTLNIQFSGSAPAAVTAREPITIEAA